MAKNTRLRTIHEQVETAHFVCNVANMLKALAFAAVAGAIFPFSAPVTLAVQNLVLSNRFPVNLSILANSFPNSTLPALGAEFSFTPDIIKAFMASLPEETAKQNPPALPLDPISELPYFDAVYALINSLNILQALTGSGNTNNGDSGWVMKHTVRSNMHSPGKEIGIIHKGLAVEDESLLIGARGKRCSPIRARTKQAVPRISGLISPTMANITSGLLDIAEDFEKP